MKLNYTKINESEIMITACDRNITGELVIPSEIDAFKVVSIGSHAFSNNRIESLMIPDSITSIGSHAFENNQIESLVIPDSITSIDYCAFRNNQIESLVIPDSVTSIGSHAFRNNQIESLMIPDSVTHIDYGAFMKNRIVSLMIPDSVTHIGSHAFRNNQIESFVIPDSVTSIGIVAFDDNVELSKGTNKIKMIDCVATIISNTRTTGDFEISHGQFFNNKKQCFVATRGEFNAHGESIKDVISDVNFKYLQNNTDVSELVEQIKSKQTMSVDEYRLITGACRLGCQNFMESNNLIKTEYPLDEVLVLTKNQYGWNKIQNHFNLN